ncbi:ABC transporter ATP-binding protein [Sphingomonas sp. Tas61C01]|uniref:ABC transporter ATP-binding protein n=1 Tax=Sphingomonas sp. Tas61C01 TaxID=3458297 RepID=UPI00403E957B
MDLTFDDVGVTLGGRSVLSGIDASLRPGRVTAILGPNGAGKSTLVKAAAGLVVPDRGRVRLGDHDVATLDPRARARAIGYLPQDAVVHWNILVREVVALGRMPHVASPTEDAQAIARALAETDTAPFADRPVAELSGGERARVLLARVLAGEPRWLLVDEPLASLDPAHQFDLLDRLRDVARAGAGVVMVLHDLAHAARIADDVLVLDAGRLVSTELSPAVVAEVFGVTVVEVADADGRARLVPTGRVRPPLPGVVP